MMEEGEDITSYFQKFDSVVDEIRYIGGTLDDKDVIENIMRTLLECWSDNISAIEETYDPSKSTREQLYGALTAFEMRKFGKDKERTETTFKATKSSDEDSNDESLDEMKANFVINLKRETNKYKGILPLKFFKCGKIGHYASRCPNRGTKKKFK